MKITDKQNYNNFAIPSLINIHPFLVIRRDLFVCMEQ